MKPFSDGKIKSSHNTAVAFVSLCYHLYPLCMISHSTYYVFRGYCNWKDSVRCFKEHKETKTHGEAVEIIF